MLKRYQEAFPDAEIDGRTFMCGGSVEKMTDYLSTDLATTNHLAGDDSE